MAVLANDGKNSSKMENHGTSTKQPAIRDSTKSIVKETGVSDFAEIRYQPGFVDQSLLVEATFCGYERIILLAPRRSGKSVNISMLKRFFEILPDQEALRANRKLFEGLEIEKYESTMKVIFGKRPVLFLDFQKSRPVHSYKDAFKFFCDILHRAYKSHAYLQTSDKLGDDEKSEIEMWLDDHKYRTLCTGEEHIYCGFQRLTKHLQKHFYRKVILLVDEYDSVWSDYVKDVNGTKKISSDDEIKLKDFIIFYTNLLRCLTVRNDYVNRAILTGIYSLQTISYAWISDNDLLDLRDFDCRENPRFSRFFGNYIN